MHNIILFGEAGSGKSSLVNMIVGGDVARVSGAAEICTFKSEAYDATIANTTYKIYDTAGLNEGDQGRVPHWKSIQELYTLIRELDGISLLIYVGKTEICIFAEMRTYQHLSGHQLFGWLTWFSNYLSVIGQVDQCDVHCMSDSAWPG
jgi:predicted GTPase